MPFERLVREFQDPGIEYRPELRWWLAEGAHTEETLRAEIAHAHRLGFGAMEFLAMDEPGVDHARYGWGSEAWSHSTGVVLEETTARGMGVSFTSGANWSNANLPTITGDDAAASQELNVVVKDLVPGGVFDGELPRVDLAALKPEEGPISTRGEVHQQHLVAVVAVRRAEVEDVGSRDDPDNDDGSHGHGGPSSQAAPGTVLDADSALDLTTELNGTHLAWTVPDQPGWTLMVFWRHGTGQTANPSATVNYTVNYLDRAGVEAVIDYWDRHVLTPQLRETIARNPRVQMYMDSLEVSTFGDGGQLWSAQMVREFESRRGYSIIPWLPFVVHLPTFMAVALTYTYQPEAFHRGRVEKVRRDLYQTYTELYMENMLRPFAQYLHSVGIQLRAEISYGLPFELTQPGPEVDGIETESLEFGSQIDAYRLLAGPAHLFGKQYSSETGATTRNHILDHRFYDQIIATQLAAGITKTVLHGWSSTAGPEPATTWPGHEGMYAMFSERFGSRQPSVEFYPHWTRSLARKQYLLRRGRPRIDVGILRRDYLVDTLSGTAFLDPDGTRVPDEVAYATRWMRDRNNFWWRDLGMQDNGYTYEFLDPALLLHPEVSYDDGVVQPHGPGYQALLVYQDHLDADAALWLLEQARAGLKVVIVDGASDLLYLAEDRWHTHVRAAAGTSGLDERDAELVETVEALTQLPSVLRVEDPARTVEALQQLGVHARAGFTAPNTSLLTHLREEDELSHLYAYNFLYETGEVTSAEVRIPGVGQVYVMDTQDGTAQVLHDVRQDNAATYVTVTLAPGESCVITVDHAEPLASVRPADEPIERARLEQFEITVESWDAGESRVITEDRGLGYVTHEVVPETQVTVLHSEVDQLKPWSELPGIGPEVSGVGTYTARWHLDRAPAHGERWYLELGSTCGGLASASVNGSPAIGVDTSVSKADVTQFLVAGQNTVVIRVASSLNNRLLARGYYDDVLDIVTVMGGQPPATVQTSPQAHGLLGPVRLVSVAGKD
ncbi:glycosyl hydrolase [Kocuria sp.]|uniref:glycosyl hydrolase n=1 Tax=Kocuria sp. TaxID=1871328 RepID=UPI0026E0AEF9|nr:glycosyl hydrolase [Kocuria sp.]MDO5618517.1 glycosyl hydrolase [Kocuria sp.]